MGPKALFLFLRPMHYLTLAFLKQVHFGFVVWPSVDALPAYPKTLHPKPVNLTPYTLNP